MITRIPADTPVLGWLVNGPRTLDVSRLYTDNYVVPFEPYASLWQEAEAAARGIAQVREGQSLSLFGQEKAWHKMRTHEAEQRLTWAEFGVRATLMATLLTQRVRVAKPGEALLSMQASGSIQCRVDGRIVLENKQVGRVSGSYSVPLSLDEGWHEVTILLMNVHLHCLNTLQLRWNVDCEVELALYPLADAERLAAERALAGFYLSDAVLLPGRTLYLEADGLPEADGVDWRLIYAPRDDPWRVVREGRCQGPCVKAEIAPHDALGQAGTYRVELRYKVRDVILPAMELAFQCVALFQPPKGLDAPARKRAMLEHLGQGGGALVRTAAYRAVCQLASGAETIDAASVRAVIAYVNDRYDCADFALHGLLRLHIKYGGHPAIPEDLREEIKACILGFKYWVDEPGRSLMFTRSENHEMLFYSAEYLAGLAFPLEIFPNSGQNGLFHELKGRIRAQQWIREKGHFGFTEWHSNTYYEEDMLALLNIWEFGEENGPLRQYAKQLMDLIALLIASNSHRGIMATTHGRCYENTLMHPRTEAMSRINWLLFGAPEIMDQGFSIGAATLADSAYLPPEAAVAMALREEPLETRTRMGLFREKNQGGVNCSTYRTRDYMVSGLVESNYGEHGAQVQAGQALLAGEVPVFVTCFADRSPTTRPSYWGGQHVIPKTIAHRNLLAYVVNMGSGIG